MGDDLLQLERDGAVWVLRLVNDENRFDAASVRGLHAALDEIELTPGPAALVTTGSGKFFSNGLDLDGLLAGEGTDGFIHDFFRLLGRVLGLDMITVAAVNGHAFAGGAMLASAHDFLLMREDRGYWCVREVDIGLPLAPPLFAVLTAHVPRATLAEASLTGRRYGGRDAAVAGIATASVPEAELLPRAVDLARTHAGKPRDVLREHKRLLYGDVLAACGVGVSPA